MLNWRRIWGDYGSAICVILALILAWDLLAFAAAVGYENQAAHHSAYDNQTIYFRCLITNGPIPRAFRVIVRHPDVVFIAITAFATIAIANFTHTLQEATAEIGARQSKDTRILQRAYVSALPGGIWHYRDLSNRLACNVIFHNAGNLPARGVSWCIKWMIDEAGDREDIPPVSDLTGSLVIPPRIDVIKGDGVGIKVPELDARYRSGARWIYVYGRVEYKDGFREEKRWTRFCHRYYVTNMMGIRAREGRHHEHGNHTDEE